MKTIATFTTSRAEFGLLSNLLSEMGKISDLNYILFAGGSYHLHSQGKTLIEMEQMGFNPIAFNI